MNHASSGKLIDFTLVEFSITLQVHITLIEAFGDSLSHSNEWLELRKLVKKRLLEHDMQCHQIKTKENRLVDLRFHACLYFLSSLRPQ
jgi:septin family protein